MDNIDQITKEENKRILETMLSNSFEEQLEGFKEFFRMSKVNKPYDLWEPHLWYDKLGDTGWHCELFGMNNSKPLFYGEDKSLKEAVNKCCKSAKEFYENNN